MIKYTLFVISLIALSACTPAHSDSTEIKLQTAIDGSQCYLFFQNGELKGGSCK